MSPEDRLTRVEARLARLEKRTNPKSGSLLKLMSAATGDALGQTRRELEAQQLKFTGVWCSGRTYEPNSLTVRSGGLWISLERTSDAPGSASWQLVTKKGDFK